MDRMFIENQEVNVSGEFSTLISYAIDDIREFGTKNSSFSKTLIIPGTKNNNKIFGNVYEIKGLNNYDPAMPNVNLNFNPAVKARCYYFRDSIQAIKGVLQLLEIKVKNGDVEYEVAITGELGGFVSDIAAKTLDVLDFSAYNHNYTIANIVASWDNAGVGSGYVYPHIDYGKYSILKHNWIFQTFRPALFAKEYIDKIFAGSVGYTYDSPLFNSARFKTIIVPHNQKTLQKVSSNQLDIAVTDHTVQPFTADGSLNAIVIAQQTLLGTFVASAGNTIYTYSGATQTGSITVPYSIRLDATAIDGGANLVLNFYHSGGGFPYANISIGFVPSGTANNLSGTATNTSVTVATGDYFKLEAFGYDTSSGQFDLTIYGLGITYGNTGTLFAPINLGESVPVNDMIPKNILIRYFKAIQLFTL
jgi:hypothetical protein